jgi:hypothetical protein
MERILATQFKIQVNARNKRRDWLCTFEALVTAYGTGDHDKRFYW